MGRFVTQRSKAPKWNITIPPTGFHNVANTLEKNGVIYSDTPVGSDGLQYFEVTVKDLRNVYLGVGLFQSSAGRKRSAHLDMKCTKIWWSDGPLQSFKTMYGTRHRRKEVKLFSTGDVIGCGARPEERIAFLTKNGAWLGDYFFDTSSWFETRLAVFICSNKLRSSPSSPWFDLRISFDEHHTPFAAHAYLSRTTIAQTRQSVGHAPLPSEVISIILGYVVGKPVKTDKVRIARLRLVCSHWSVILWPTFLKNITIRRREDIEYLMRTARHCDTTISNNGRHIQTLSLCKDPNLPPLEIVLLSSLGTHATQLTQLAWDTRRLSSEPPLVSPPRIASMLPSLLRHLHDVHTLHLERRSLQSCAQLFSIIHALPSLQNLTLEEVTVDRVGPVRTHHVAAARQRLQKLSWNIYRTTIDQRAAMAAVAARLCTVNSSDTSAVAEAVSSAPWYTRCEEQWFTEYTYKTNTGGEPDSTWSFRGSCLVLKWSIPPAEENSPTRARLLVTLDPVYTSPTVELALKNLDPHLRPHYPLTVTLKGPTLEPEVPDLQARLPEIMPRAHRLGLITIESSHDNKQ